MRTLLRPLSEALRLATLLALTATSALAAATVMQQIDPPEVNIGDQVVLTLTLQGGTVGNLNLPPVDGLRVAGTRSATNITFSNGTLSRSLSISFLLVPSRAGDFVIPAFDIHTQEGDTLHAKAMKVHVLPNVPPPNDTVTAPAIPSPNQNQTAANAPFNPNGPVVMPPANAAPAAPAQNPAAADTTDSGPKTPRGPDGRPAKVFMIITPQTTDAYVGEAVPMRIDFYIRMDVIADQNSLPTINGSNFLMNNFVTRGHANMGMLENEQYECETWLTAVSAPKSGDFPLAMTRDSYWVKSVTNNPFNPFNGFFGRRANLAHEPIVSNQLLVHVHPLPLEGQPDHFSGAIGQFQVTGDAQPVSVSIGEPVSLNFSISGTGNFDYVRCPSVADDPVWKSYVPSSKTSYRNESHTTAVKTFLQAIIPNKNGIVPLPAATFSYFDPQAKKYVTVPISLPAVTVTGSMQPAPASAPETENNTDVATTAQSPAFMPNRLDLGYLQTDITPDFRKPWFWVVQGGLLGLPLLGALFLFLCARAAPSEELNELSRRRLSQQQEESAMSEAVRQGDAQAFFHAARHVVQLQLGAQWKINPEALTLGEIRARDPLLADRLGDLFEQADEVIYSGRAASSLNLADWEQRVRELLQPQSVSA